MSSHIAKIRPVIHETVYFWQDALYRLNLGKCHQSRLEYSARAGYQERKHMSTQREIKFRAWGEYGSDPSPHMIYDWQDTDLVEYVGFDGGGSFHIMQYTGLKDKNGKEIYEGDILSEWGMDKEHYRYAVEDMVDFLISYGDSDHWDGGSFPGIWEVIGNIYENPELLGETPENPELLAGEQHE